MKYRVLGALLAVTLFAGCEPAVTMTGPAYTPVSPEDVRLSFAKTPDCVNPREIGSILNAGGNSYMQERTMGPIREKAASMGANYALLETTSTSLMGDMLVNAVLYRCDQV